MRVIVRAWLNCNLVLPGAFIADPRKNARHVMHRCWRSRCSRKGTCAKEVGRYCAGVPCYGDLNERFIGEPLPDAGAAGYDGACADARRRRRARRSRSRRTLPLLDPSLPSVRVIVRGWLNCNQVLLLDDAGHTLVDSGYSSHAHETLRRVALPEYLGAQPLARLVNTHCHADHIGGNAALVRRYGCTVGVPAGDAPQLRPWNGAAFMTDYADHEIEPFDYNDTLAAGDRFRAGGLEWQALAAPGHDMNALVFWCEERSILISGDALWENGLGALFPQPSLDVAAAGAYETLERIAALAPRWVIPGHGEPFRDVAGALVRARRRLDAFAVDAAKNARHVAKSLLVFALLAKGGLRADRLVSYFAAVPCYRDLNERFLGRPLPALAHELLAELEQAKIVESRAGWLRARIAA